MLVTLFTALFIPINAAESDTSENVGIEEITPRASNGCNNVRVLRDYEIYGYTISMDAEYGGSGPNIHIHCNNKVYYYDFENNCFETRDGIPLPGVLNGNEKINSSLEKAKHYYESWL